MSSASSNSEGSDRVNRTVASARTLGDAKAATLRPSARPMALCPELLVATEPTLSEEDRGTSDSAVVERVASRPGSTSRVASGRSTRPSRRGSLVVPARSPNAAMTEARNQTNTNLFIRNLHHEVAQSDVDELFSAYGTILSSAVMRNIHTGESLGTGFVRFETHAEAKAAMTELNGHKLMQKNIIVQWAKKHDGAPVGEARRLIMKLFVRNIPLDVSVPQLTELFSAHGPIQQVTIHKDTSTVDDKSMERHIAFVIYTAEGAAERAATAIHNSKPFDTCHGIPLMVKLAEDNVSRHDRSFLNNSNSNNACTPNVNSNSNFGGLHSPNSGAHGGGPMHPNGFGHRLTPAPCGLDMPMQPMSGRFHQASPLMPMMGSMPYTTFCPPSPMANYPSGVVAAGASVRLSSPVAPLTASTPVSGRGFPTQLAHGAGSPFALVAVGTPTASARTPHSLAPPSPFVHPVLAGTPLLASGRVSARPRSYSTVSGASVQTPTCFHRDTTTPSFGVSPVATTVRTTSPLLEPTSSGSSNGQPACCGIPAPRSSASSVPVPVPVQSPVPATDAAAKPKSPYKTGYRHDPYNLSFSAVSA